MNKNNLEKVREMFTESGMEDFVEVEAVSGDSVDYGERKLILSGFGENINFFSLKINKENFAEYLANKEEIENDVDCSEQGGCDTKPLQKEVI